MPEYFPPEECILNEVNTHYGAKDQEQMLDYFRYVVPVARQQNVECNSDKKKETCG
jgi:hypothetical protein